MTRGRVGLVYLDRDKIIVFFSNELHFALQNNIETATNKAMSMH